MRAIDMYAQEDVVKVLIANKCDLPNRQVTTAEGEAMAQQYNVPYLETSALSGAGVTDVFNWLSEQVVNRMIKKKE